MSDQVSQRVSLFKIIVFAMGGGRLFMHFTSCQNYGMFGSWGAVRYQDETAETRPKYRAILDALRGALPVTGD